MVAAAPALMSDIAALRTQFPSAKVTHFKAGSVEYGEPAPAGWPISDELVYRVNRPAIQAAIEADQKQAKRRSTTRSRKR